MTSSESLGGALGAAMKEKKMNMWVTGCFFFFPRSLVCLHYLSVIKFCTQPSKICHFNCSSSILFTNLPDQIPPHLCPGLHAGLHCELCRMHVSRARREGLRQVGQMFAGGLAVFSARPLEDLSPVRLAKGLIISSRERNDCVEVPIVREC